MLSRSRLLVSALCKRLTAPGTHNKLIITSMQGHFTLLCRPWPLKAVNRTARL